MPMLNPAHPARPRAFASPIALLALGILMASPARAHAPDQLAGPDTQIQTASGPPATEPREDKASPAIDLSVVYTLDLWRNARGGLRRGERYLDNLDVTLTVDADRALGWAGATLFLYGLYNNGNSLTDELVGDLQVVSNIDAGVQAARLYEAWVEQRFGGGRASVKFGLYDLNSEFDTSESSSLFINSSQGVGPDFSQSGQNGPSIFPVTSLALRADYKVTENWLVRAALLDGVPGDPNRPKRTTIKLGNGDGALLVAELEYSDELTKAAAGHWRYTARFEDILATAVADEPVPRGGSDGLYMFVERKLTGGSREAPGLSAWVRLGFADENFNPIESYQGGGLVYTGLLAGRAADQLGLAVASAKLGQPYRRALELAGKASEAREINLELTYRAAPAPWLTVQPDVQYVISPGADPMLKNALVIGLRIEIGL